jgi:hypothetical protein
MSIPKLDASAVEHGSQALLSPNWIELQRVVSLAEAARPSSMSIDTIRRRHADKIIKLSLRRSGMRLQDALNLSF